MNEVVNNVGKSTSIPALAMYAAAEDPTMPEFLLAKSWTIWKMKKSVT